MRSSRGRGKVGEKKQKGAGAGRGDGRGNSDRLRRIEEAERALPGEACARASAALLLVCPLRPGMADFWRPDPSGPNQRRVLRAGCVFFYSPHCYTEARV